MATPSSRPTTTAFAKTARPEIACIVPREALFVRLDGASTRTVAWITGPAGSGKSTLAASYLAARNYRTAWYQVDRDDQAVETFFHFLAHAAQRIGLADGRLPAFDAGASADPAAFARGFFRRLFSDAGAGAAIVIDGLAFGDDGSPLRRCIEAGLTQVPRHCAVVVTSREEPSPAMARMRANGEMAVVGADELRFAPSELEALARLRGRPLQPEAAATLHERTQGWAAAAVLMLEHAKIAGEFATLPPDAGPAVLFDYVAGEIFARFEPSAREILLRIACLPRVTSEVAAVVGADARAARLLLNLSHNDYFVREVVSAEQRVYVLHPLYREFLLRTAARDRPELVAAEALVAAARALQDAGLNEDAVPLMIQAAQWDSASRQIAALSDALIAQGRRSTLEAWLEHLPPPVIEADAGLLCVDAACRLGHSPRAARLRFEQAWRVCRDQGDVNGRLRACAGVVDAIVAEFDNLAALDDWLPELRALLASADYPPAATRAWLRACLWREPFDAQFRRACEQGNEVLGRTSADTLALRRVAALLRGDLASADALAAQSRTLVGEPQPAALRDIEALHAWLDGDLEVAWRTVCQPDADAEVRRPPQVLHTLLQAGIALAREDESQCARALEPLGGLLLSRGERALLHVCNSALASLRREPALALREARGAVNMALELGLPWIEALALLVFAQTLSAAGDASGAQAQAIGAAEAARRLHSQPFECSAQLLQALVAFGVDDEDAATASLRQALRTLRHLGVCQAVGMMPSSVTSLLAHAVRLGIEVEHAQQIARRLGLRPPPHAQRLRRWPWRFDLCTLGAFELQRDGLAIEFSAKGPGRPLELLKMLVAYGGRHVRVDEITDTLWPHVDGDYAYKSFTATLHRLRRLLGEDEALLLRDGRLSLNPSLFWLDVWAFDHLVAEIDGLRDAHAPAEQVQALCAELVALYRGPFLADEADQPAYIARREQLRGRLLRALTRAWPIADGASGDRGEIDAYARCLQADELCEALHREMMLALLRHGETARAAAAYQHLCVLLAARLRAEPAPETRALYQELVAPDAR